MNSVFIKLDSNLKNTFVDSREPQNMPNSLDNLSVTICCLFYLLKKFETDSHYVVLASLEPTMQTTGLELTEVHLPLPPVCLDSSRIWPCLATLFFMETVRCSWQECGLYLLWVTIHLPVCMGLHATMYINTWLNKIFKNACFVVSMPIGGRSGKNKWQSSHFPDGNKWGNSLDKVLGTGTGQQMPSWKGCFLG